MSRKIIIDCDPGVDDAYAIMYALAHPELDVVAITTVSGNVSIDHTTRNAQKLVSLSGKSLPIGRGADIPLVKDPFYAEYIHGKNGLGGYELDIEKHPLYDGSAIELIKNSFDKHHKLTIVALGPLTNIGHFLILYPEYKERIEEIVIMGGGLKNGNTTAAAEFNIYVDPEAARIVFHSGIKLTMAGLDVTEKALLFREDVDSLDSLGEVGSILANITRKARKIHGKEKVYTALHDLVSVMYLVKSEIFETKDYWVDIICEEGPCRGMTLADRRSFVRNPQTNTTVILNLDRRAFLDELFSTIDNYNG